MCTSISIAITVYKTVWTPRGGGGGGGGEELETRRELNNDRFDVAVIKGEQRVGHIPEEISVALWSFFEYRTSHISCKITNRERS